MYIFPLLEEYELNGDKEVIHNYIEVERRFYYDNLEYCKLLHNYSKLDKLTNEDVRIIREKAIESDKIERDMWMLEATLFERLYDRIKREYPSTFSYFCHVVDSIEQEHFLQYVKDQNEKNTIIREDNTKEYIFYNEYGTSYIEAFTYVAMLCNFVFYALELDGEPFEPAKEYIASHIAKWYQEEDYSNIDIYSIDLTNAITYDSIKEYLYTEQNTELPTSLGTYKNVIKPLNYSTLNSKISNSYFTLQDRLFKDVDGQYTMDFAEVIVANEQKRRKEIVSQVSLTYGTDLAPQLQKLTGYDRNVMNTVCSIFIAGNTHFTETTIYQVMNGNIKRKPSEKQKERIDLALHKLNNIQITIDTTEEIERAMLTSINGQTVIKDRLLQFRQGEYIQNNGQVIRAYELLSEPVLLSYSKAKSNGAQLITFPTAMLDIKGISATEKNTVLKEGLAKEITHIKNGYKKQNKIKYSTFYERIGLDAPSNKVEAQRRREDIKIILTEWKEHKYIKDFKEYTIGRTYEGIEIIY